jgi:hypothetical protein
MLDPANLPGPLSAQTQAMIRRDLALSVVVRVLDGERRLSCWKCAGLVAEQLRRFTTARRRIEAGHREPQNEFESALLDLGDACPGTQRRLFDLLRELRLY